MRKGDVILFVVNVLAESVTMNEAHRTYTRGTDEASTLEEFVERYLQKHLHQYYQFT